MKRLSYDREFMFECRSLSCSMRKPENLPVINGITEAYTPYTPMRKNFLKVNLAKELVDPNRFVVRVFASSAVWNSAQSFYFTFARCFVHPIYFFRYFQLFLICLLLKKEKPKHLIWVKFISLLVLPHFLFSLLMFYL